MTRKSEYDGVVIGSGPNGLAAAIVLARAGRSVVVFEAEERIGGGTRSSELTLPGFTHDVCSAVHPMAVARRQQSFSPPRSGGITQGASNFPPVAPDSVHGGSDAENMLGARAVCLRKETEVLG